MLKARAERKDNGELIEGYYVNYDFMGVKLSVIIDESKDDYMPLVKRLVPIDPTTLAVETNVLDKNKKMIFGSIEVDGKMSTGGDTIKGIDGFGKPRTIMIIFSSGAFFPLNEDEFYWTDIEIIGGVDK